MANNENIEINENNNQRNQKPKAINNVAISIMKINGRNESKLYRK
jgi:hypothetical protein